MFRRTWQSTMIGLARSPRLTHLMQTSRAGTQLARRYVGGSDAPAAVRTAEALMEAGLRSSLFYLGEYVNTRELMTENVLAKLEAVLTLQPTALDMHISVDPTQLGHSIDPRLSREHTLRIAQAVADACRGRDGIHCVMLDMEDHTLLEPTIALHDELRSHGLPAALTLQAYLRRTESDMAAQVRQGSRVRLVKGAFAAGSDRAFTMPTDIKDNYRRLVRLMFGRDARATGFYPIVATHDDRLHAFAIQTARANGWKPGEYEFEMLLGARPDVSQTLASQGERVRLYVPFGRDWWPYAVRRIGENPRNAALLMRSLLGS